LLHLTSAGTSPVKVTVAGAAIAGLEANTCCAAALLLLLLLLTTSAVTSREAGAFPAVAPPRPAVLLCLLLLLVMLVLLLALEPLPLLTIGLSLLRAAPFCFFLPLLLLLQLPVRSSFDWERGGAVLDCCCCCCRCCPAANAIAIPLQAALMIDTTQYTGHITTATANRSTVNAGRNISQMHGTSATSSANQAPYSAADQSASHSTQAYYEHVP
jgi:hypothetical protein